MASTYGFPPIDQPGFDLQSDQSQHIIATSIALITLATFFVASRLISRWLACAGYWWDDILIVIALLLAIVPSILNIWGASYAGVGKHIWALEPSPAAFLPNTFKMLYIFQIFFCLATATIKLCTLAFYKRIFPAINSLRVVLFFMATVVVMFLVASTSVTVFQCSPIHRYWDLRQPGTCLPVHDVLYGLGAINTVLDFLVVLLPVPLLWQLRTSIRQKCLLTGIFTMAGFVCIVSMIRLLLWSHVNSSDVTWNSVPVNLWSATEPVTGIICACIPSLRPLLTIIWHSISSPPTPTASKARNSLSKSGQYRQDSVFSMDSANRKMNWPVSDDLEEMGKIARGGSPWGCNATAYGGVIKEEGVGKEGGWVSEVHVPSGQIAVQTDWRVSICSNAWEYMDRVY